MKKMTLNNSIRTMLLVLLMAGSFAANAQIIGIVQALTPIAIRQGPSNPTNGLPQVEFPYITPGVGQTYSTVFLKYDSTGKQVVIGCTIVGYHSSRESPEFWLTYCVGCLVSDFPQVYRITTLVCPTGNAPCYSFDSSVALVTNSCTNSNDWSSPATWNYYKTPNALTSGLDINKDVNLDTDFTQNHDMAINYGAKLSINPGVSLKCNAFINYSYGSPGEIINNGILKGARIDFIKVTNNAIIEPGNNGIGIFNASYSDFIQTSTGSMNIQLGSTTNIDNVIVGTGVLNGTLNVSLLNGFNPVAGNFFKIFSSGSNYTGTFATTNLPALATGLKWNIKYNPKDVTLTVVDCGSFSISYTKTNAGCYGTATGSITVTPTNGVAPYQYKLNSGVYGSSNTFTGLKAGNYKVYITDANGCTGLTPVIAITQLPAVTGTASATNASCYGTTTGSITVTPTTGTTPFTYRLGTTGSYVSANTFINLKAGAYVVYIKDANGCTGYAKATVSQPPAITGTFTKTDVSPCYGGTNGSLTVTATTGFAPYQYKLNVTGTYGTSNTFSSLRAATYKVYVKDANGCEGIITVAVGQPAAVAVTYTKIDMTCTTPTGTLTLSAPGSPGATFRINPGSSVYTSQNSYSNLAPNSYYGYAKNTNGCIGRAGPVVFSPATGCRTTVAKETLQTTETGSRELSVSLSPNPSSNVFKLTTHTAKAEAIQLRVIDINGKVVYTAKGSPTQAFTFGEAFTSGVYLIEVRQGNEVKMVKAVKMQ